MEETLKSTLAPLVANLRSIHLHWNTCITDDFLSWVAESMPRLEVRTARERGGAGDQPRFAGGGGAGATRVLRLAAFSDYSC